MRSSMSTTVPRLSDVMSEGVRVRGNYDTHQGLFQASYLPGYPDPLYLVTRKSICLKKEFARCDSRYKIPMSESHKQE